MRPAPVVAPVEKPPPPAPPAGEPAPPEAPPSAPARAPAGALPPRHDAPLSELPDLIEVEGRHLPARVVALRGEEIELLGADGRVYALPARSVARIADRADLARRVAAAWRRLAPDDAAGRVELAEWCAARLLRDEARQLVRDALSIRPDDPLARAAQARLEGEE
jgi:hypothetical protein